MGINVYNILINKGETYVQTFRFRHALKLAKDLTPSTTSPPTTLSVCALPIELPAGYIIEFPISGSCETIDLEVATTALLGDEEITIVPYTGTRRLRCGTSTAILPLDLTGLTWRGSVRTAEDDAASLIDFSFSVPAPTDGSVEMSASATLTASLESNVRFDEIPCFYEEPLSIQQEANFEDEAIYDAAYFWDLEYEDQLGNVARKFYGRCWVVWESTQ